jgi:hypothetical protein
MAVVRRCNWNRSRSCFRGVCGQVAGPGTIETDEGIAWHAASKGRIAGAMAAPAIGAASPSIPTECKERRSEWPDSPSAAWPDWCCSGTAGGSLWTAGSPMGLNLPHPAPPAQDRVCRVVHPSVSQPALVRPLARRPPPATIPPALTRTCSTPDQPGTPPTVIPETPPLGDMPGTLSIPGTTYPCDWVHGATVGTSVPERVPHRVPLAVSSAPHGGARRTTMPTLIA